MDTTRWERWAPATGLAALAVGAAAVALERPWPDTLEPAGFPAFLADNRAAVVTQSLLFLVSAGLFIVVPGHAHRGLPTPKSGPCAGRRRSNGPGQGGSGGPR
jgi:hypothetical protein